MQNVYKKSGFFTLLLLCFISTFFFTRLQHITTTSDLGTSLQSRVLSTVSGTDTGVNGSRIADVITRRLAELAANISHVSHVAQPVRSALSTLASRVAREVRALPRDELGRLYGGRPVPWSSPQVSALQVVMVSTWRSGSTFMEALFDSHPAMFDVYEPLSHLGLRRARNGTAAKQAQAIVGDLLQCRYENQLYRNSLASIPDMLDPDVRSFCEKKGGKKTISFCSDQNFLSNACQMFPLTFFKTVRLKLELMKPFLEAPVSSNLQLIYLVRDPRAVINSRRSTVKWCKPRDLDCYSPAVLCADMEDDLHAYKTFKKLYPDRVHLLRYEDLMANVSYQAQVITEKVGLSFTTSMEKFVVSHTNQEVNTAWTTSRKSSEHLLHWTHTLSLKGLWEVEAACTKTMEKFGYKTVNGVKNLSLDDVLTDIILDE